MVTRKLDYYLQEAETTIRSDHLPLKSFLLKNTKNDKVNNWGVELALKYTLNFEYVKGIKNTLADTMSRLVTLDPDITPEGYQFSKQVGSDDNVTEVEVKLVSLAPVASAPKIGNPMCRGITRIHRLPSRPSHPYGRQPHSLIFMSTLYKASSRLPASS